MSKEKHWAVYKGDNFKFMGTTSQCAEHLGIKVHSFKFLTTPTYRKRTKRDGNSIYVVDVTEVEK